MIIKKASRIGNSWGIIIPPSIWKVMSINPVTDNIAIDIDGDEIKIKKVKETESK